MISGVNLFYFMVSAIQNLITDKLTKSQKLNNQLFTLYTLNKKAKLNQEKMNRAKIYLCSLYNNKKITELHFLKQLSKAVRTEGEYCFYLKTIAKNFPFLQTIREDILVSIGRNLKEISFNKSK